MFITSITSILVSIIELVSVERPKLKLTIIGTTLCKPCLFKLCFGCYGYRSCLKLSLSELVVQAWEEERSGAWALCSPKPRYFSCGTIKQFLISYTSVSCAVT